MRHELRVSWRSIRPVVVATLSLAVMVTAMVGLGNRAYAIDKFKVQKTAVVSEINAGDLASFTIVATAIVVGLNNIVDNFTLTDQLPPGSWSVTGPNAGSCTIDSSNLLTCLFGGVPEGETRTITVSLRTSNPADCNRTISNTARVTSDDVAFESPDEQLNNVSTATINVHCAPPPPPPGGNIVPTGTTCQQWRDGTASNLNEILYGLKDGVINNVAPGIGFYFVRWSGGPLTITQSDNGSTPAFGVQSVQVYTASNCERIDRTLAISAGNPTTINGAAPGGDYIVRLAFDPNTVKGSANPGTVTYTYTAGIANSTDTIVLAPKP